MGDKEFFGAGEKGLCYFSAEVRTSSVLIRKRVKYAERRGRLL